MNSGLSAFPDWLRSNQAVLQLASLARVGALRSNAIEVPNVRRRGTRLSNRLTRLRGKILVIYHRICELGYLQQGSYLRRRRHPLENRNPLRSR
jgi:hypothetical protein